MMLVSYFIIIIYVVFDFFINMKIFDRSYNVFIWLFESLYVYYYVYGV